MHTRQKVDWSIIPVSLSILYHTLSSSTDRMLRGRLSLTACESNYFLIKIREKEKSGIPLCTNLSQTQCHSK